MRRGAGFLKAVAPPRDEDRPTGPPPKPIPGVERVAQPPAQRVEVVYSDVDDLLKDPQGFELAVLQATFGLPKTPPDPLTSRRASPSSHAVGSGGAPFQADWEAL